MNRVFKNVDTFLLNKLIKFIETLLHFHFVFGLVCPRLFDLGLYKLVLRRTNGRRGVPSAGLRPIFGRNHSGV